MWYSIYITTPVVYSPFIQLGYIVISNIEYHPRRAAQGMRDTSRNKQGGRRHTGATLQMAQMAKKKWIETDLTSGATQYNYSDFTIKVRPGHDLSCDRIVTEFKIYDKRNYSEHYCLIVDKHGNELHAEWCKNL